MAKPQDDIFLEHIEDLSTHEGYQIVTAHIQLEAQRTGIGIVTRQTDDRETQFKRGFYAGLQFAINATEQVKSLRLNDIEAEKPTKKGNR